MKNYRKLLAVLLALVMLFCCSATSVIAAESTPPEIDEVEPYVIFVNVWSDIYKTSWGYYDVSGGATAYRNDTTVYATVYIEVSYGTYWERYDSWEVTDTGAPTALAAGSRTLTERGTYRAHTVAEAYRDGVLIETVESYSTNVVVT
jgi:hypothetical protein